MVNESHQTVLVADDNEILLGMMASVLGRDKRFRVLTAQDGEEALDIARREMPGLMLTDVSMPKLNGFEVCRVLKSPPATKGSRWSFSAGLSKGLSGEMGWRPVPTTSYPSHSTYPNSTGS